MTAFPKFRYLWTLPVALAFLVSCAGGGEETSQNSAAMAASNVIPAVEAVQARYGSLPLSERLSGTVIANNQVVLYPEINGRIAEVLVQNGESVREGDPLVRLDDSQYREQVEQARSGLRIAQARLKQAEARLQELEAQYRRVKALADENLSSQLELETLQAQMASAEADVDLTQAQLEQAQSSLAEQQEVLARTVVRAPVSGTLGQRNAEVGMQVSSGTQLFIIGDLSRLRVEVVLTENMLEEIETGQTARIYTGEGENLQSVTASLSRISPFLHPVTRSTEAEIDLANQQGRFRPGMFVPVDILYGESRQATLIPTSALFSDPNTGENGVFVARSLGSEVEPVEDYDPNSPPPLTEPVDVTFQPVEIIARGRMEVGISGIDPGSWVVTVGQDLLYGGRGTARVRTVTWERILALQGLQQQDLLNRVLREQRQAGDSVDQANSTL
ncbi:MAG: efflux RND transporter periplasmic adaptor subunit [Balneolaceae bacterium]|nr:efflux RND transporter periplasmic adaptor subunit [Balneolaceae bacterium]